MASQVVTAQVLEFALPGYRITRELPEGGQARVWQAIRLSDRRKVAIKLIHKERVSDPAARARFKQEYETLARLDHPNIVRILEHGETSSGELWHVTEYIAGVPINEFVDRLDRAGLAQEAQVTLESGRGDGSQRRRGLLRRFRRRRLQPATAFPVRQVLGIFVKICDAVEAAHQAGVVHRDLKPSNILVDDHARPVVLDFGLAKLPQAQNADAVTMTHDYLGSPAWSAPEQVEGRPSLIDPRTDVYALGVVLYNLLTGTFPYDVDQPIAQVFDAIRHADPIPPRNHATFIPEDLQAIILKTLQKSRDARYPTAGALGDDLQRYLVGKRPLARPERARQQIRRTIRRHPVLAASIAVAFALSLVYSAAITVFYRESQHRAEDARQKFRMAQDALSFTLKEVSRGLSDLAGASTVRESILRQTYEKYARLVEERSDDPALQEDFALAHQQLSDVALALGNLDLARNHRESALAIRQQSAQLDRSDSKRQAELALSLVLVGDIEKEKPKHGSAREWYDKAHVIYENLAQQHPDSLTHQDDLSWSYERLGSLAYSAGDLQTARSYFERRHEIATRLVALEPESLGRLEGLHVSFRWLAILSNASGEFTAAKEFDDEAFGLAKRLYAADPQNSRHAVALVSAYGSRIATALDTHDAARAEKLLQEITPIVETLAKAEPERLEYQEFLAGNRCDWGLLYLERESFEQAYEALREAYQFREKQLATFPDNLGYMMEALGTLGWLAHAAKLAGQSEKAVQYFETAHRMALRVIELAPDDAAYLSGVAVWLGHCAYNDRCDPAAALSAVERSIALRPDSLPVWRQAAEVYRDSGRYEDALGAAERALSFISPGDSVIRRNLETLREQCHAAPAAKTGD